MKKKKKNVHALCKNKQMPAHLKIQIMHNTSTGYDMLRKKKRK